MLTRRQLMKRGAVGGAGLMMSGQLAQSALAAPPLKSFQTNLLDYIPPIPKALIPDGGSANLAVRQVGTVVNLNAAPTKVWRYEPTTATAADYAFAASRSWIGPILEVDAGSTVDVSYDTDPDGVIGNTHLLASSIDRNILDPYVAHGANTPDTRFMTHLHGAFVDGPSDGNPYATEHTQEWRPPGQAGPQLESKQYPPQDRAGLIWYHQHAHGITHLNVYAGLAGGYLLRDQWDTGRIDNPLGLPANRGVDGSLIGVYEVPLVIQDRIFRANALGTALDLFYPPAPWVPEFFGDTMCVNGAVEPFMNVEPRPYRFRIINGCNARFLNLSFLGGSVTGIRPPMHVIGSDGGFVPVPWTTKELVIAPGERYDIVVDFSGFQPGERVNLSNKSLPRPVVNPAGPLPRVMQFRVANEVNPGAVPTRGRFLDAAGNPPATLPITGGGPGALVPGPTTRHHTFEEVMGMDSPLGAVVNGMSLEGRKITPAQMTGHPFYLPSEKIGNSILGTTEKVPDGATEDWVFANTTADTHPLHMHLVQFGVIERVPFNVAAYLDELALRRGPAGTDLVDGNNTIDPLDPRFLLPGATPVSPAEKGWKDTVQMHPGEITRIRMKFDLKDRYTPAQRFVFHCHILEHESNSMMRPYEVVGP